MRHTMDHPLMRWLAALELVRAQDLLREVSRVGRATNADTERLHDANVRWSAVR